MHRAEDAPAALPAQIPAEGNRALLRRVLLLAAPVMVEHLLHILVGVTDTWLANHLVGTDGLSGGALEQAHATNASAAAAVGTITYVTWLIGLVVGAIGAGSTAIIARATGARHRGLANAVCGQSVTAALIGGAAFGGLLLAIAPQVPRVAQLSGESAAYASDYLRMLSFAMPFTMVMLVANACLRGAGDTLTPALSMIVVDVVNIVASVMLTYGLWGAPRMGFDGIATGTLIAWICGGLLQFGVLVCGRGGIRLFLHRMPLHAHTMRRILRVGLPNGLEGAIQWTANFAVLTVINRIDAVTAAAHLNTVRIESFSYMTGFALATAAATLVGQSLGRRDPVGARRAGLMAYAVGGALMTLFGLAFMALGGVFARWLSDDPRIIDLTRACLFITGIIQFAFASAIVFSGALRGAGDTRRVMALNLASVIGVRLTLVLLVSATLGWGLPAIWVVLSLDLTVRGALLASRFAGGRWQQISV